MPLAELVAQHYSTTHYTLWVMKEDFQSECQRLLDAMDQPLSAPILKHFTSPKYAGLLEYGGTYGGAYLLRCGLYMPWELSDLMDRHDAAAVGFTVFRL